MSTSIIRINCYMGITANSVPFLSGSFCFILLAHVLRHEILYKYDC